MNGSATFTNNQESNTSYFIDSFHETPIDEFIIKSVEIFEKMRTSKFYNSHLSFAWEHDTNNAFYKNLEKAVASTEVLVVIGYSFPFFNRDIDKLILQKFMGENLKKVYFQAPENDVSDIRERFLAINDTLPIENLLLRTDIQQFTLPNEL